MAQQQIDPTQNSNKILFKKKPGSYKIHPHLPKKRGRNETNQISKSSHLSLKKLTNDASAYVNFESTKITGEKVSWTFQKVQGSLAESKGSKLWMDARKWPKDTWKATLGARVITRSPDHG